MKKINVAELLRNCPKGMELDCTMFDYTTLHSVLTESDYPIRIISKSGFCVRLTKYGQYANTEDAKCVIFPRGKTTWEGFVPPCEFKDGDIIFSQYFDLKYIAIVKTIDNSNDIHVHCLYGYTDAVFATNETLGRLEENLETRLATENEKEKLFNVIKENGYRWDNETKTLVKLVKPKFKIEKGKWYVCIKDLLDNYANKAFCKGDIYYSPEDGYLIPSNSNVPSKVEYCTDEYFRDWTIQDAKDGDVIFYDEGWTCIFKRIHGIWYSSYCFITSDGEFHTSYDRHAVDSTINGNAHLATKEQSNLLFQKITEAGYKWNDETKTLVKLVEPYFKVGDKIRHKSNNTIINTITHIYSDGYALCDGHLLDFTEQDQYELVPKFKVGYRIKWVKTGNIYDIIKILSNCYIAKYLGSDITILFDKQDEYELVLKFKVGDRIKPIGSDRHYIIKNIKIDRYILNDNKFLNFTEEHMFELVPNKFGINNLKPFDKVLVRTDNEHIWSIQLFERLNNILKDSFVCMGGVRYRQCIPYEGNEHLLNTANDCDDYFKTWQK